MAEGSRKFLTTVVFGLLSLAALVLILVLKQFSVEVFKAWLAGTAAVFGVYQAANVVSKFSPQDVAASAAADAAKKEEARKNTTPQAQSDGLLGLSGKKK